jgi:predicted amidohydrolase YtcJ
LIDVLIRGGMVYDGTGADPVAADVAICGDRVAWIRPRPADGDAAAEAGVVVDATGKAVCPGFINILSHSGSLRRSRTGCTRYARRAAGSERKASREDAFRSELAGARPAGPAWHTHQIGAEQTGATGTPGNSPCSGTSPIRRESPTNELLVAGGRGTPAGILRA